MILASHQESLRVLRAPDSLCDTLFALSCYLVPTPHTAGGTLSQNLGGDPQGHQTGFGQPGKVIVQLRTTFLWPVFLDCVACVVICIVVIILILNSEQAGLVVAKSWVSVHSRKTP